MHISLTRVSPTHHRLDFVRGDGSHESIELETKTFLFHDLLHFAAESTAKLQTGFWGSLASGKTLAEMNAKGEGMDMSVYKPVTDLECMEIVVGALTGSYKTESGHLKENLENLFEAYGLATPAYVNTAYELAVLERMRQLLGEWNSLKFGETMRLEWD